MPLSAPQVNWWIAVFLPVSYLLSIPPETGVIIPAPPVLFAIIGAIVTDQPAAEHNLPVSATTADIFWMRRALREAERAAGLGEVPVGAIAVLDGEIIGRGFNRKESDQDPTAHAELIALREAAAYMRNWRLIGVTLYSTLEPCPMCAGAMIQARLARLVYGAPDTRFGADGTIIDVLSEPNFNHRVEVVRGVLAAEAGELLQQFFRTLRQQRDNS